VAAEPVARFFEVRSSRSSRPSRSVEAASVSLRNRLEPRFSSCITRALDLVEFRGIESISMRSFEPASSTRSIALSGRNRSAM